MTEERKKILFIVEAMGGGVFTYIVDLANELVKDYDMYIAYQTRRQTPENYKEYFDSRINLIEVKNFGRSISFTKDIKAFFEIRKIAREIKPDIIHLHSSKAGALGRFAFNGNKVPLFYTPHGYSFLMKNHSSLKRTVYRMIEKVCALRNCTTISCSEGEHEESLKLTQKATYVDNGINMSELQTLISSLEIPEKSQEKLTIYTLGRICYQKNPKLFNQIALALPDVNFVWIGDGELRDELTSPNIKITGWADRKEALKCSLKGDIFILTSLWEGLPISLLESMYMKKLCVVSNVIGNRDVIHDGINGLVCDDAEDFVHSIRNIMNEREKINNMTEIAYKQIDNQYNTKMMAKKYSQIYMDSLYENKNSKIVDILLYHKESKKHSVLVSDNYKKVAE